MRANLRRRMPQATNDEIEEYLARWLEGPDMEEPDRVIARGFKRR